MKTYEQITEQMRSYIWCFIKSDHEKFLEQAFALREVLELSTKEFDRIYDDVQKEMEGENE